MGAQITYFSHCPQFAVMFLADVLKFEGLTKVSMSNRTTIIEKRIAIIYEIMD